MCCRGQLLRHQACPSPQLHAAELLLLQLMPLLQCQHHALLQLHQLLPVPDVLCISCLLDSWRR